MSDDVIFENILSIKVLEFPLIRVGSTIFGRKKLKKENQETHSLNYVFHISINQR